MCGGISRRKYPGNSHLVTRMLISLLNDATRYLNRTEWNQLEGVKGITAFSNLRRTVGRIYDCVATICETRLAIHYTNG